MTYDVIPVDRPVNQRSGPGRPRDETYDDKVLDSALRLIGAGRPATIREVIKMSGVSRTAIYRRWKSVNDLIAAALDRGRANNDYIFHGPIKSALVDIFFRQHKTTVGPCYGDRHFRKHLELMMSNPQLQHSYWQNYASRRTQRLIAALSQAASNGEIDATEAEIEAASDAILGVQLFQYAVRGLPVGSEESLRRSEVAFEGIWRGLEKC